MPQRRNYIGKLDKQPWWNNELSDLKNEVNRQRRLGLKRTDRSGYSRVRNMYLGKIRAIKMESWRVFASDLNVNTRGKAFRWIKTVPDPPSYPHQ